MLKRRMAHARTALPLHDKSKWFSGQSHGQNENFVTDLLYFEQEKKLSFDYRIDF